MQWPLIQVYLDTASATLSAADFTANVTNLSSRPEIGAYLLQVQSTQGRQNSQSYFDAGTLSLTFDNQDGRFDPTYTQSPFYPNLGVGNHITIVATPVSGSASPVFSGYIDSIGPSYSYGYEQMVITATDMFKALNLQTWQPSSPVAAQTADARVNQILTDVGFSTNWRVVVGTPQSVCAAIPANPDTGLMDHSEPALGAMQAAVHDTEDGLLYVRGDGRLVVADRYQRANQTGAPSTTFGDASGTGEVPYETDIQFPQDDALLVNGMTVTNNNGVSATYSDATSIGKYGPYFGNMTSLTADANEPLDQAWWHVITAKSVTSRVDTITVNPVQATSPGDFSSLLPASPGWQFEAATCTVKRRPLSGNVISINCFVERVAHTFDGDSWSSQLGLSNSSQVAGIGSSFLILNDAAKGKLNTGTLGR